MVECSVQIYTKAEKKPQDFEEVIVFFGGHRAPDYYDPYDQDFHFYGHLMKPSDLWMRMPPIETINK